MSLPPAERDAALLLDMLTWAGQAADFVRDLDEASFHASKLHQAAVTRCIAVVGEAAGRGGSSGTTTPSETTDRA